MEHDCEEGGDGSKEREPTQSQQNEAMVYRQAIERRLNHPRYDEGDSG